MAEKMAEAPPSPQKKKCQVAARSSVYKVSNNPKPRAKKEVDASLNDASKGGGGKGISFRPDQPYLHHATKEQLMAALEKIINAKRDAEEEHVGDDGDDKNGDDGEHELHGGGVSSCARSSSRTRQHSKCFAHFGNDKHSDSSYEVDSNNSEEDDLDDATGDELDDDGDNDNVDDDGDGRLCVLRAKLHKDKVHRHRENSPRVWWRNQNINLGTNFPKTQAIEMRERAKALTKEWRSMQPIPTKEWVILELERLGVRKMQGYSAASLSDELKVRKEDAEVSINFVFVFVCTFVRHSS